MFVAKIDVETTEIDGLKVGEELAGARVNDPIKANWVKNHCRIVGTGRCCNKNKTVILYQSDNGQIYGTSTVLPYRYFILYKHR